LIRNAPRGRPEVKASAITTQDSEAFWQVSFETVLSDLATDGQGLTSAEAERRLRRYGANLLGRRNRLEEFFTTARRLVSPLILILICASAVSAAVGETVDASVIAVMVAASLAVDAVQTHRSSKAAGALRARVESKATVLRDAKPIDLSISQVVPGDRIFLKAGDVVPADGQQPPR
jgi:Mg2+-importing ATPase